MKYSTPRIVQDRGFRFLRWVLILVLMCGMALVGYYASRYQAGLGSQELQSVVRLQQAIAERLGFRLVDHRLELYGVPLAGKTEGKK